ncbi:MAG: aminotransferase class I/II-fold pyridoxal phosphate-dependent enzyme [Bacteroidetes bacterium]|jgi:threonine aldolase|nr:aminotransferase class I/II-fold pyridoxal phosphate-dependent enzyme [Bacteroidota bacterium]
MIDLRSDTVTRPTDAMRQAMASASVGDDVYGEDPTVTELEVTVAELLGKAAGLFVPSGVMANQIGLMLHTAPGDEVIVDRTSHIFNYETGGPAALGGVQLHPIDSPDGLLTADLLEKAIRPAADVFPRSRLLSLENSANKAGGRVYRQPQIEAVATWAKAHGYALHLDGARLWNAAVATGASPAALAAPFDTVWVALSKGLGAPVGSVLAGSEAFMQQARRLRKRLGGGMRQAGIIAAGGLHAVHHHRERLQDDHTRAQRLAAAIAALPPFHLEVATVETNIIIFDVDGFTAADVLDRMHGEGIQLTAFGPHTIRATTHLDVDDEDITRVIEALQCCYG